MDLTNTIQVSAHSSDRREHGYQELKPKKDLWETTASDAKTLVIELADFEIDLGELGYP